MVTFNSRYLTCKQVSEQFIPTPNFYDLAKACHTVLLGARGSGKTTMLKMLQPEAIIEFQKVDNNFDVPFYGVYIPSDRQWSFILERLDAQINPFYKKVSQALVNLNVLLAFLETLCFVLKTKNVSPVDNYNFCKTFIKFMRMDDDTPPILEIIRLQLRALAIDLQNAVRDRNTDYEIHYVCKTNFIDSLSQVLQMIDMHYASYELKDFWALCFDEMEIAPAWFQKEIATVDFRSRNQRLFFKITSTPDWNILGNNIKNPSVGNDFEVIKCWNYQASNMGQWREFCDAVIYKTLLCKYELTKDKLLELISVQNLDRDFLLKNLPKVDQGFSEYFLRDYSLNTDDKVVISRASVRSKFYNGLVLAMRYFYYCGIKHKTVPENNTYLGNWLLYNMADGNPRSLFNVLNEISSAMEVKGKLKMNIPALSRVVREYSSKAMDERFSYCAMQPIEIGGLCLSFRDILLRIGNFFRKELLSEEYNPFPRTMFTIDEPHCLYNFVHVALEVGAVIRVDDQSLYSGKFDGGVFRLTYLLYPYFGYVPTSSKEVVLISEILGE